MSRLQIHRPALRPTTEAQPRQAVPSGGRRLPEALRARFEEAYGAKLDDVRVHESNLVERLGAMAFTRGKDIHIARSQFKPWSRQGQSVLAHEVAHVIQQRETGRVPRAGDARGIVDRPNLEAEADRNAERALAGERIHTPPLATASRAAAPVQPMWGIDNSDGERRNFKKDLATGNYLLGKAVYTLVGPPQVDPKNPLKMINVFAPLVSAAATTKGKLKQRLADMYKANQKMTDAEKRSAVDKSLERNLLLSDSESEPDTDDEIEKFVSDVDTLYEAMEATPTADMTEYRKTADTVHDELNDPATAAQSYRLTQPTFEAVARAQEPNERRRIRNNVVLRHSYREAMQAIEGSSPAAKYKLFPKPGKYDPAVLRKKVGGTTLGEMFYGILRSKMGENLGRVLTTLEQKFSQGKYKKKKDVLARLKAKPYFLQYEQDKKSERVKLINKQDKRRSFALHHNQNKGGPTGFPVGSLSPHNLTLENDYRSKGGDIHFLHHAITSGGGSGHPNYAKIVPEVAMAQIPVIEAESVRPRRKASAKKSTKDRLKQRSG